MKIGTLDFRSLQHFRTVPLAVVSLAICYCRSGIRTPFLFLCTPTQKVLSVQSEEDTSSCHLRITLVQAHIRETFYSNADGGANMAVKMLLLLLELKGAPTLADIAMIIKVRDA